MLVRTKIHEFEAIDSRHLLHDIVKAQIEGVGSGDICSVEGPIEHTGLHHS